jgi:hypothetical protein
MIVLIPLDLKRSIEHFEEIHRYRSNDDYALKVCTLRVRVERKYKMLIVLRLFTEDREYQRLLVSEAKNTDKVGVSTDYFNAAKVPSVVSELVQDWVCEYVEESHCLIEWRSLMGEDFTIDLDILRQIERRPSTQMFIEPVADENDTGNLVEVWSNGQKLIGNWVEENPPLTEENKSDTIKEDNNAFSDFINSEDWKHDA